MAKDPNYDRYEGIVTLPNPWGPPPRPYRVDEDGRIIYRDEDFDAVRSLGEEKPVRFAQAGVMDWDELARKAAKERAKVPTKVIVDPSCETIPAAYDPFVQKTALEAFERSVNDEAAGKVENGFFASPKIFDDGYSVGPIFKSGFQRRILRDSVKRMKHGWVGSFIDGTFPPELFVHAHPNNRPPSPPGKGDKEVSNEIDVPIASIDSAGNLFCVLPGRKRGDR
ncbi:MULTISPECIES: hypothetical protein [Sphingomonadales]